MYTFHAQNNISCDYFSHKNISCSFHPFENVYVFSHSVMSDSASRWTVTC